MNKEKEFMEKENLLVQHCKEVETQKLNLEEKYNKLVLDYKRELKELKEDKLLGNMKEQGKLKSKISNYEKMVELMIYFFKRIDFQSNISESESMMNTISLDNFTPSLLQQKLLELENYIESAKLKPSKIEVPLSRSHGNAFKNFSLAEHLDSDEVNLLKNKVDYVAHENHLLRKKLKECVKKQKVESEDTSRYKEVILVESRRSKSKKKCDHEERSTIRKYNSLERKFDEFQKELAKAKQTAYFRRLNSISSNFQKEDSPRKENKYKRVVSLNKSSTPSMKPEKDHNSNKQIKQLAKTTSLVFHKGLTDALFGPETSTKLYIKK